MRDIVSVKYTDVPGAIPLAAYLTPGELALNRSDGYLFYLDVDGNVKPIGDLSGAVVRPGGPFPEPGIDVSGTEFFIDNTVVRTNPAFVPNNPDPDTQTIIGIVDFSTHFPTTGATGSATVNNQLVNVYTLNQQKLSAHQDTLSAGLTLGSIYQYNGVNWEAVLFLDGGSY